MANIIMSGSAVVLKSGIKLEVIEKLKKYSPESLIMRDEKERLTFKVDIAACGAGDFTEKAVFFAPVTHDPEGLATVSFGIPSDVKEAKKWVADALGNVFPKLQELEAQMVLDAAEVDKAQADMLAQITVQ